MSKAARYIINNYEQELAAILAGIRKVEELLGPSDDWVEDDRRILFEFADMVLGDYYVFVYNVGNADYVTTAHASPDAIERLLDTNGYDRNLVSGRKFREHHDGGKQWAEGSWALYDGEGHQHHVYLFESPSGGTDIYAHYEDNVTDPAAHLHVRDDEDDIVGMRRGDPGSVYNILDRNQISYGESIT